MKNWKFTSHSNDVAFRVLDNGVMESYLVSTLPPDTIIEPADPVPNPRIDQIKAELIALDAKKVRPLATGDTEYLANLNVQSDTLRDELKGLMNNG